MHRPARTTLVLTAVTALAAPLALLAAPATAGHPHRPDPAGAELVGWASLPADTFVPGSEPSGCFTGNAAAPFPGQPVQGFSGVHALGDGSYLVMSDNGFGAKANSQDFLLRVHRIKPDTVSETVDVLGGFYLSDPHREVPWTIWRDGGCAAAASLPAGYTCPAPDRRLTGSDFDIESMQLAPDHTLWFGDEFGPFLLHTDLHGRLLEAPIPTPGVKSPSNPTLASGEQPNLANSKGFEGMAISPGGQYLYPMLEGPTTEDQAAGLSSDLRIYTVRRGTRHHRTAFPGEVRRFHLEDPGDSLGDLIAINNHQFLMIERDNFSGGQAVLKRVYLLDFRDKDHDGYVDKTLLVDLMNLPNPQGLGGFGDPFTFPYVTIEDLEILDRHTIAVLNDNNYPGTGGRGTDVKDVNEYLEIDLGTKLNVDRRLLPGRG
jgi:hypothetical protein